MLFLLFCKPLFSDSAKPSLYIPCKNLVFTYSAETYFYIPSKKLSLHNQQHLKLLFCETILLILPKPFYLFCKPHFTYSAIPSFLHILWKPPFKLLTTDAAEIYLSCKYERHSHYAQYVNLRILPKLSAVHHNPKLAKTRRNQFQPIAGNAI